VTDDASSEGSRTLYKPTPRIDLNDLAENEDDEIEAVYEKYFVCPKATDYYYRCKHIKRARNVIWIRSWKKLKSICQDLGHIND
jgi:hypothetical protein